MCSERGESLEGKKGQKTKRALMDGRKEVKRRLESIGGNEKTC